jgi:hypothetical protein
VTVVAAMVGIWFTGRPGRPPKPAQASYEDAGATIAVVRPVQRHALGRQPGMPPAAPETDAGSMAEQQGRSILAGSRAAYAACSTYEDRGTYDNAFRDDAGFMQETEFHTLVDGPRAVRFSYRDLADRFQPDRLTERRRRLPNASRRSATSAVP